MQCTIRFFFSFIFLCGIFSNSSASGVKGDRLFASGKYFEAAIEYEYQIFTAENQTSLYSYKYKKALCYKHLGNFGQALTELQPMYFSNSNDTLYKLVCYEQALCFFLNGEPKKALWKIDEYFHRSSDSISKSDFMPIRILSLNDNSQWEEAKACFFQFIHLQNFPAKKEAELSQTVESLYNKKNLPKIRSIKKAENLSRFFPGSGQIYAGKTGEGIVNFLLNASVLAFSAIQVLDGFYITGYFAGLGFFNKTYHGGIKRAGILATQKNEELFVNFNSNVNATIRSCLESN